MISLNNIELWQGDCLELMKNIPDKFVDMVLCDPPYGINYSSNRTENTRKTKHKIINDEKPFIDFIFYIDRILKPTGSCMIFTRWDVQQKFIDELNKNNLRVRNVLIWNKQAHGMGDLKRAYASCYESIIFCSKNLFEFNNGRPEDILSAKRIVGSKQLHPNQKPVDLLQTLIEQCTKENEIIFDPFMGSGSTGVACVNTNRKFIGIELDPKYFEVAKNRIENT